MSQPSIADTLGSPSELKRPDRELVGESVSGKPQIATVRLQSAHHLDGRFSPAMYPSVLLRQRT